MTIETVSNIEIAFSNGTLVVTLVAGGKPSYQYVYRAAAGVYWNNDAGAFEFDTKNDSQYAKWFAHIREVLAHEMGVKLQLSDSLTWTNVPNNVQREITLAAG